MSTADSHRFGGVIQAIADAWAIPGGIVVATDRTGVVFEQAFGFADLEGQVAATKDHLFEIGSISKIMTATVVLQLVQRGLLSLDQAASTILEELPAALSSPTITVERLLRHSAGLVSGVDAMPDQWAQVGAFRGVISNAEPGEFFHYSNLGYILLGLMVERVSGRRLVDLVGERILDPIGATDSIARVTFADRRRLARGYQPLHEDLAWVPGDALVAAPFLEVDGADGSVATTGRDLAAFARMLLNRGSADNGDPVLEPSSFEAMTALLAVGGEDLLGLRGLPVSEGSRYGLGINLEQCGGSPILTHGGGMIGYASFLLVDPAAGFAVVALTNANGDGPVAEAIARSVAAILAGSNDAQSGSLSPELWRAAGTVGRSGDNVRPRILTEAMLGTFAATVGTLEVRSITDRDGLVRAEIEFDGHTAPLQWDWGPRALTRLPGLKPYPLEFLSDSWCWGEQVFRPITDTLTAVLHTEAATELHPFCGHFRSYSPWFTNFRTVVRGSQLMLIAAPGVEAPSEDVVLVPLGHGVFRMGADPRLPERLAFGPPINGASQWADRDGCRYSRSFTP